MAVDKQGIEIDFTANFSDFKKQLQTANREISATTKEAKAMADSLRLNWDADKFKQAQTTAQKAITETETKADALRNRLKQMDEQTEPMTAKQTEEYRKWQAELVNTETKVEKLQKSLEDLNKIPLETVQKKIENLGQGLTKAGQAMMPVSAAAAALDAALLKSAKDTVSYADDIATTATALSISAEKLQELQYIATVTEVPIDSLTKGFNKFSIAMGQTLQGQSNYAVKALEQLGFTADKLKGQTSEAMFDQFIEALANVKDKTMQATLAGEVFGTKMSVDMIPMLAAGADGIEQLKNEFQSVGYMTNDQVKAMSDFMVVINGQVLPAVKNLYHQLGYALLPVLQQITDFVQTRLIPIFQKIVTFFQGLSTSVKDIILVFGGLLTALAPVLLIGGKIVSAIGPLLEYLPKIKEGLVALTGPVGIIIAVLGLLYATNENFRNSINNLFKTIASALMPILKALGEIFAKLVTALMPIINLIGNVLADVINALMPIINNLLNVLMPIINVIMSVLNPILDALGFVLKLDADIINTVLVTALKILYPIIVIVSAILNKMSSEIENSWNYMKQLSAVFLAAIKTAIQPMIDTVKSVIAIFVNLFNNALAPVMDKIKGLIDFVKMLGSEFINLVKNAIQPVIDALQKVWNWLKNILGLKDTDLQFNVDVNTNNPTLQPATPSTPSQDYTPWDTTKAQDAIAVADQTSNTTSAINNVTDNSTKNFYLTVQVENYNKELDIDSIGPRINRWLAENS